MKRLAFLLAVAIALTSSAAGAHHRHHHHHWTAAHAQAAPLPPERPHLLTIPEAKTLLHQVDQELAPALLTNLDLDFAKACLMSYGLKRLEEMKREAER